MGKRLFSDEHGRVCSGQCGQYKTWDAFANNSASKTGKRTNCRECRKATEQEYVRLNNKINTKRWRTRLQNKPFEELTHGKYSTYAAAKCRCKDCSLAYAEYLIERGNSIIQELNK